MNYYEGYLSDPIPDLLEQIREALIEVDRVCNEEVGAKDYYEKCLHELAAYDRFKESIREICTRWSL